VLRAQLPLGRVDVDEAGCLVPAGHPSWVGWWNTRRLHGACGGVPPAEFEEAHYRHADATEAAITQ
jgi:hypothetical protein